MSSNIITFIFSKASEYFHFKNQLKYDTPLLSTYVFDNPNTSDDFLKKIIKCEYIYFLSNRKDNSNEAITSNNPSIASFKKITKNECIDTVKNGNVFGMVFSNLIENSVLNIKSINLSDGSFNFMENETMLSSLGTGEKVCILSLISETPKNFSGIFKDRSITYLIQSRVTGQIYPVFKSTY